MNAYAYLQETDVARRWWTVSRDIVMPLSDGATCRVDFQGRPGGSMGPDVRDAVLIFMHGRKLPARDASGRQRDEKRVVGDVEFHIRSSDWCAHAHDSDPRYNNVILHVVLIYDDVTPIRRQDGRIIPTCCLNDLPPLAYDPPVWPCRESFSRVSDAECARLLTFAGLLRFEQKTQTLLALLRAASPHGDFSAYDTCLISALAEGLGYGRDRVFFRAAGLHLLDMLDKGDIPEPLGHSNEPPPLDARRLGILGRLVRSWRATGLWETLREVLLPTCATEVFTLPYYESGSHPSRSSQIIQRIRAIFEGLSPARTDILICNVVLPFAAAVGLLENDARLAEQAESLYVRYPALPSNTITRAMCRQLQLSGEPRSACQQQGLHYIYAATCREKLCARCIAGKYEWRTL
ncbi:MAG TPA: DUF2851 family protein [Ktedonobacteraceae bacterium]|nr:DUF2851 family protein [Ktedonobacteraceae bacterium]